MKNEKIYIEFLYGLPGSGKSHYSLQKQCSTIKVVDFDYYIKNYKKNHDRFMALSRSINEAQKLEGFVVDSLFTESSQILEAHKYIEKYSYLQADVNYYLTWWEEDRETCLINDLGRRKVQSKTSIQNMKFEIPDLNVLSFIKPENVKKMNVKRKDDWKLWVNKIGLCEDDVYLKSDSWSLGGTWGDCWGNRGSIDAESPNEFVKFDELLSEICPGISFLQYKKIKNSCVSLNKESDNDYYGGSSSSANWCCNFEELYTTLKEMNLIDETKTLS